MRIDRRRKLPVTTLLLALGLDQETILNTFYHEIFFSRAGQGWRTHVPPERLRGQADGGSRRCRHRPDAGGGRHQDDAAPAQEDRRAGHAEVYSAEELVGRYLSRDLINEETGLVLAEAGDELTGEAMRKLAEAGSTIPVLDIDHLTVGPYIRNTLALDRCQNREEALLDIYRVLRPGEPPTLDTAEALFNSLIFDPSATTCRRSAG